LRCCVSFIPCTQQTPLDVVVYGVQIAACIR
jgi:hypothetical protein